MRVPDRSENDPAAVEAREKTLEVGVACVLVLLKDPTRSLLCVEVALGEKNIKFSEIGDSPELGRVEGS